MKRKWIKWVSWVILTPILLFVVLMILLYVPPVQNFLRKQATAYASQVTGMQINVGRIDLRFPLNLLVRDVEVIQVPDTLLTLASLNVHVQAMPLFKGKIEVDDITIQRVAVNSANLIEGMQIRGVLGRFFLESHGVDLGNELAVINRAELSDTHIGLILTDTTTTEKPDTASAPVNWKVNLHALNLKNVSFSMQLPADSMRMAAHVGEATVNDVSADLKQQFYGLRSFLLTGASVNYDTGNALPAEGFDPSHIALRDIRIGIDSVLYQGRNMNAVIREFSMNERSGLSVTSLTGRVFADSTLIRVPYFRLLTPHSEMNLTAQTYWELVNIPTTGRLTARFNALIGKQDVLLFAGELPDAFKDAYPFRPLVVQAGTEGNLKSMQISRFKIDLPGAFSLDGGGELYNLMDSVTRSAAIDLKMRTGNLNFLTALADMKPGAPLVIPDSMLLDARLGMEGPKYDARLQLKEKEGRLNLTANLNTNTEVYSADLKIEDLQVNHFLPHDSIYELTTSLSARGRGLDFTSYRSVATVNASIDKLHYADYRISGIELSGAVKNAVATAQLTSDNALLKMKADAEYHLAHRYPDGKVELDVTSLDTEKLVGVSLGKEKVLAFQFTGEVRKERVFTHLTSGDLKLNLSARAGLEPLIRQSTHFADILMRQLDNKELNHAELRKALPTAIFSFSAGRNNPMAWYLATQKISYQDASVKIGCAPDWGINGKASLHALKIDTLQLDTIFLTLKQDTSRISLHGGVINGPKNPQISFKSILTGEIRDKDAELTAQYINDKGKTGLLFGVNAKPLYGGRGKGNGIALTLIPEEPVIAFHKFRFEEHHNWIYLHNNMRVYANVDMQDNEGMGIRMQSLPSDTVSLQNMDVELRRIRLDELFSILPYMPDITGLLSAEAHYIQTENSLELSAEASIDELTYERQRIGDVSLGATWLPGEAGKQYVNTYLTHEGTEIMVADGALYPTISGKDSIVVNSTLEHFPLTIANVFVPDQVVTLSGDMDGDLHITGYTDTPLINGGLSLDSVSVYARQADARFTFDNRPIQVQNNRIVFDKFAIYTTSKNPFSIDGYVDFRDMSRPMANLKLFAENYTLLNAKRTKESMVYGKVFVDLDATVRGPLEALMMRGNVNLLGNTDVTYVLTDSPLTVQDRLSDLVTFTSFADTTSLNKEEVPTLSLGGLDMIMTVHIDPAVRLKADLSADRSSRVELEGGGDLSLQYTPQGDLTLTGRYTLTGGMMKYALPVIPLKEFQIQNGSYVDWTGNPMDPLLNFRATERMRASVSQEDGTSRMVNFDISIVVKNRLDNLSLAFEIDAPDDASVQNQLAGMGPDERSKQAVAMLATGIFLADSGSGGGMNLNMGAALNSVLASQINALTGNMKNASLSFGVEDHDDSDAGGKRTDYSFRYSQRLFNDRFQIVLGGKVSTGANATNDVESFIDNISLEYRLDQSGTRYIRLFHNKNYESVFEGEITETGVGLVLRKKMDRLSELFIFKKKKK
ncbi:translocation/assembly module TamB domain-containing protein [Bacteroides nordii]|uniref:translocation/assembly module TamB domain-containing protein n=1 Tax=Bacteroides nordii TaxID=291645 RepID=UPI000959F23A|nr:translocation/assembly module TamB domain-containing protein [Bacteroides nordii]MCE8463716.1 translocation/assembly module TamB domain-containing protein [Bacteroides nordii]OKZ04298.1 MAG: translocation/assembly module TamB [Bacteroides sp. 41_26]UYU49195.1 translocation/assembly module TamB [Bacteroides nordii]